MKIKTSELTGAALDWAVAKCERVEVEYINDGITRCLLRVYPSTGRYSPSTDWAHGGPIIEREKLQVTPRGDYWDSIVMERIFMEDGTDHFQTGPTPLIAAMRCYAASKLGEEVDVPDGLT